MERKINLDEILIAIFEPVSQNCTTPVQDLQLAVTLNPNVDRIKDAMKEACRQTLELAAENATLDNTATEAPENKNQDYISHYISRDDYTSEYWITIDKQSILDTINQIE